MKPKTFTVSVSIRHQPVTRRVARLATRLATRRPHVAGAASAARAARATRCSRRHCRCRCLSIAREAAGDDASTAGRDHRHAHLHAVLRQTHPHAVLRRAVRRLHLDLVYLLAQDALRGGGGRLSLGGALGRRQRGGGGSGGGSGS